MSKPLIHGDLEDYLTGQTLPDTDDERYRQKLARFLVEERGFRREEVEPRVPVPVPVGASSATETIDLVIRLEERPSMVLLYGPGSLVSRHRIALALSRLLAGTMVPVVVVSNGEDADVLAGDTGRVVGRGLDAVPSRRALLDRVRAHDFAPLSRRRLELEARIASAFSRLEDECQVER